MNLIILIKDQSFGEWMDLTAILTKEITNLLLSIEWLRSDLSVNLLEFLISVAEFDGESLLGTFGCKSAVWMVEVEVHNLRHDSLSNQILPSINWMEAIALRFIAEVLWTLQELSTHGLKQINYLSLGYAALVCQFWDHF